MNQIFRNKMNQDRILISAILFVITMFYISTRKQLREQLQVSKEQLMFIDAIFLQMPKTKDGAEMRKILESRYGTSQNTPKDKV